MIFWSCRLSLFESIIMQCHTHSLTNIDMDEPKWLHIRQSYHATAGTLAFGIKEINIVWVIVSHSYQEVIGYLTTTTLSCFFAQISTLESSE